MPNFRFGRSHVLTPDQLGFNAIASSGAVTGSDFDVTGACAVTFNISFTRVAGTGNLAFTVEEYDPFLAAYIPVHTVDPSVGSGTLTFYAASFVKASGSASTTLQIRLRDLTGSKMRIKSSAVTSATTDTTTITAVVYYGAE